MAEPTTFPEDHISEPVSYQRISGFAIAGLVIGIGYTVCLAFAGFLSLRYRSPLILPVWVQAVPFFAVVLCVVALVQISQSGGILAGAKIARTAFWVSLIVGLGYSSYYGSTRFAVVNQANNFTLKWFDKLAKGQAGGAFLDTRDPSQIVGINPDDEERINNQFAGSMGNASEAGGRSTLDLFRESDLYRLLGQGEAAKQIDVDQVFEPRVTPMGVTNWEYKNRSYTVQRVYRIETVEGTYAVVMTGTAMESLRGEFTGRQWYINLTELKVQPIQRTKLSQAVQSMMTSSSRVVGNWLEKVVEHQREEAFLETKDAKERARLRSDPRWNGQILMDVLAAGTGAQGSMGTLAMAATLPAKRDLANQFYLTGFKGFCGSEFLTTDKFEADFVPTREQVGKAMQALFEGGTPKIQLTNIQGNSSRRFWKLALPEKRMQLPHDCVLTLTDGNRDLDIQVIVTAEIPDAAQETDWRIVSAELVRASRHRTPGAQQR